MADKKKTKAEKEAAAFQMLRDHIARQEWDALQTKVEEIKLILRNLPSDKRLEILSEFCAGCGGDLPCYCQNDE